MDVPQLQQQTIPAGALRLADLTIQAGPREIEFEIELPKGAQWDLEGRNELVVASGNPEILAPGEVAFEPVSMRFMVPVSAVRAGEVVLTYGLKLAWRGKDGQRASEERTVVQRVAVDPGRGATVPWVHYKAQANQGGAARPGPVEE